MEQEEITPEWVKQNLCMDDGNDITKYYSEGTIKHIAWCLRCWESLDYKDDKKVLNQFHLIIKKPIKL